jgi:phenylpropionate dioxygenase-like ring-hydroxylating dioxygenase large terminal subunit
VTQTLPDRTRPARPASAHDPLLADLVAQVVAGARLPLEEATTLPAAAYCSPEFYELERRAVLSKDWVPVARVEQVPDTGSFLTVDVAGEALVVVRGQDGVVRALSRVCRHRYADVLADTSGAVPGSGCLENFTCPYHMWTYRLDGSLITAVDFAQRTTFEPEQYGLRPVRSQVWQGFVFVNLDDDSDVPLGMEVLEEAFGNWDLSTWKIAETRDWGVQPAGWKVAVENFLEFYHHIGAHLATLEVVTPGLGTQCYDGAGGDSVYYARCPVSAEGAVGEVDGHLQPALLGVPAPEITPAERSRSLIGVRFPLFMVVPGADFSFWLHVLPDGPTTHRAVLHVLVPDSAGGATTAAQVTAAADFFDAFQGEDAAVNERVQAMMASPRATGGVLHDQELPLLQFQRYLAAALTGAAGA